MVTLSSSAVATAGETHTVTCIADVVEDLVVTPILQWFAPDGSAVNRTGNPSEETLTEQVSTLRFTPVHTSHRGTYSCVASITIPGVSPVQSMESTNVTVKSEWINYLHPLCYYASYHLNVVPMPGLILYLDQQIGTNGSATTGTQVMLQGLATLADVVDSPVTVECSWTDPYSNELAITAHTSPPYTAVVTLDPFSDGGVYKFIVTIKPSNPTYVIGGSVNASYSLIRQPYPSLMVRVVVNSGQCGGNETATLTGSVGLLSNIATNHTLTYTWKTPDGQTIRADDLTMRGRTLTVDDPRDHTGTYNLTACLAIPDTDVSNHCSSVNHPIFADGMMIQ